MTNLEQILKTGSLLEELSRSIRRILLAKFPDLSPSEREDVEQEVKLKLCRAVAHGKKITFLRSYLWKAVLTTALDVLDERDRSLNIEDIPEEAAGDGTDAVRFDERKLWLEETLESLSPHRRTVVAMYLRGMSLERISRRLSWSLSRTRHLLYRGLSDIKRKMGRSYGPETGKAVLNGGGTEQ